MNLLNRTGIVLGLLAWLMILFVYSAPGFANDGGAQELKVEGWYVASVPDQTDDPIKSLIRQHRFELPGVGRKYGLTWAKIAPGVNGEIETGDQTVLYAVAEVLIEPGERLFAQADTVLAIFTNNRFEQPGDVYGSGNFRMPLGAKPGRNLIVAQALAWRGTPRIRLFKTRQDLFVNALDITKPDLRVGDLSPQWLGISLLNASDHPSGTIEARVEPSLEFEGTTMTFPSAAPESVTQIGFQLVPKHAWVEAGSTVPVTVTVTNGSSVRKVSETIELNVVPSQANHARTKFSTVDGSVQFYGVLPPHGPAPQGGYGLILSLHGAGVGATGQSNSYASKDWAYLIAPTNRRPFGFDWEEWGRLDAIETLEIATHDFNLNPRRTHLTGHSMGGHGAWHVGVHFATRFGVVAPSAGWVSFDTYGGSRIPDGVMGRARAASKTLDYVQNLKSKSVYIIHGNDDDNVPVGQADMMYGALKPIVAHLSYHNQPGVGHWWDLSDEPGVDCVDWKPMIAEMKQLEFDPNDLNFEHISASPIVSGANSYVTIQSESNPLKNVTLASHVEAGTVYLETDNMRSLSIDPSILIAKGISELVVDGRPFPVNTELKWIGPTNGKRRDTHGPLNQIFQKPWCFVYGEAPEYAEYASYLTSWWAYQANGRACSIPFHELSDRIKQDNNIVYLGVPVERLGLPSSLQIHATPDAIQIGPRQFTHSAVAFVYPDGGKLSAAVLATAGDESLLFDYQPFSSRRGRPDYFVWGQSAASGFFDSDWRFDPALMNVSSLARLEPR